MGYFFFAIFVGDVFQNFGAAVIVEVDIDIGEGYTVGVEKTFKKEVVFYRIDPVMPRQ